MDYCLPEAVESLLPVCEEVIICDSDSNDGSREAMEAMAANDSRIRVVNWPWPNPVADPGFFVRWLNAAREHCRFPIQLILDADELIDPSQECYEAIREAADSANPKRFFERINLWRKGEDICRIPLGHCVGTDVARMGPVESSMCSDENWLTPGSVRDGAVKHPALRIWHLGFLRRRQAFFDKCRVCLIAWNGGDHDPRLIKTETEGIPHWETETDFLHLLTPYTGRYPDAVKKWLNDRGHNV